MKRTVTITFHAPNNNGAFLQAFALQKVINSHGDICNEILNYQNYDSKNADKLFRRLSGKQDILRSIVSIAHYKKLKMRNIRFEKMRNNHLKMTRFFDTANEAAEKASEYDEAIFGSDQIWNPQIKDFNEIYFGKDISCKKIAYSASCGPNVHKLDIEKYSEYICKYDSIATREVSSLNAIKQFSNKEIFITIDPTLLLESNDYDELYLSTPIIKGKYIFLYTINYNQDVLKQAKRLSKLFKLPVVTVFASYHSILCTAYGIKLLYDAGPSEFLNLIKNAEIVITNSFHGTAFSIIFRKNFYHLCEFDGEKIVRDDRIDGLLETLGLEQNISIVSSSDEILSKKRVDYYNCLEIISKKKKESLDYLFDSIL